MSNGSWMVAVTLTATMAFGLEDLRAQKPQEEISIVNAPWTTPLALRNLLAGADSIFVARVFSTETTPGGRDSLGEHKARLLPPLPEVPLSMLLKGATTKFLKGTEHWSTAVIASAPGTVLGADERKHLLVFLSDGLPVGLGNGLFVIDFDHQSRSWMALNRLGNVDLWTKEDPLWSLVKRTDVEDELRQGYEAAGVEAHKAKDMAQGVIAFGDRHDSAGPLPLDLLIAVVRVVERSSR